jgi:hypothetical protein
MRQWKLHVEAGEDLPLGRDAGTRRSPLRLDKEVERSAALESPDLAGAKAE